MKYLLGILLTAGLLFMTSIPAHAGEVPILEPKELMLKVDVDIDAPGGAGSVAAKARMALDYDDTGKLSLGKKKVELKPTRRDGVPLIAIDVYDDRGALAYHSVVPFHGLAELKAKLEPATGIHKIHITVEDF